MPKKIASAPTPTQVERTKKLFLEQLIDEREILFSTVQKQTEHIKRQTEVIRQLKQEIFLHRQASNIDYLRKLEQEIELHRQNRNSTDAQYIAQLKQEITLLRNANKLLSAKIRY